MLGSEKVHASEESPNVSFVLSILAFLLPLLGWGIVVSSSTGNTSMEDFQQKLAMTRKELPSVLPGAS